MQLNERVLPSSSSYLLRVLHSSFFAAGSKMALRHNFTKKTYERDGALRLDVFPPCDVHPGTAPGWHEVETQVLDLYHAGMEALMSHASVPDQALLASRLHASRQQQQEAQGVPRSAAVEPQIEMIQERGAGEAGEDVAGRILEAAKTRAKLTHMAYTNEHCHWRTRALLRTGRGMWTPARAVNETTMLSAQQWQLFASPPPVPSKAVMARNNHASEHRDVDSAALCAAEGRPLRARAVRVVEMMLYSYESDILLMKLMEYGDLLHQLMVIQGRTDFNHRSRPIGLAVIKHLPPLTEWMQVLDRGEGEW